MNTHPNNNESIKQNQIQFASTIFQKNITIHILLESLAQGVIVVDKSLNILLVNSQAEQMFGYSSSEILGKPMICWFLIDSGEIIRI
jgi:PAS domain-containing protein